MLAWLKSKHALADTLHQARAELRLMGRLLVANDKVRFEAEAKGAELYAENSQLRDEIYELNDIARRQAARIEELEQTLAAAAESLAVTQN